MANIRPLSDKLQKIAIEELHEVPDRIADDLHKLKIWIAKTPHLKSRTGKWKVTTNISLSLFINFYYIIIDDQFLVSFLR